jgi:uncharacterized protein (DUF1499 family)
MVIAFTNFLLAGFLAASLWLGMPTFAHTEVTPMLAAIPGFKAVFGGSRPVNLGVHNGHLSPCPASPNCVVSQGQPDAQHAIAPLVYIGDTAKAMADLRQIVAAQPGSEIVEQTETYLYAEFTSSLMGFVDDVEFYLNPEEPGTIHVRSASRLGESDLGVNRKRIEAIRMAFSSQVA